MTGKKDYVILLHGLWRTANSMKKLEKVLSADGYSVVNLNYPSNKEKIETLAETYLGSALATNCPDKNKKINFVTHSLGGIVVRYYLAFHKLPNLGRVVMMAPPNKGAKLVDFLSRSETVKYIMGPALDSLKTDKESLPNKLPPPDYEVGIIAGKYDEKVSVEYTKLDNMKDFLVLPSMHTFITDSDEAIKAVKNFLEKGKF